VRKTTDELFRAIRSDGSVQVTSDHAQDLVDRIVIPHVDLPTISRLVLGKYWRRANADQQHRFTQALHQLLLRTYATAVTATDIDNVEYLPNRVHKAGKDVTVRTIVPRPGTKPISMNYRLRRRGHDWKLVDMVVEGVSLVSTYRSTFGAQIRDKGIDGLIETMNERLRST
jgi:phospholipid transport system substrate-binding protein